MKIDKIINNNIVSAIEADGKEVVIMGRGLGFGMKPGKEIPEGKIEKVFRLDSQNSTDKFKELLANLPLEHIQASTEIINYAKSVLNRRLNQSIYITLTDHINFAIERFKERMVFTNPLLNEIKTFYKEEYLVGEYAVALIERRIGIKLPVDEAGFIALHIVNAEYNTGFKAPMAVNPLFIIPIGLIYGVIYYVVFRFAIVKFNFKTPGREDDDDIDENQVTLANNDYTQVASIILEGLGGKGNIKSVDNCITRLRLEINDYTLVNEKKIKSAGVSGVIRPGKTSVQVIVGTQVQFVADEFKKLCQ